VWVGGWVGGWGEQAARAKPYRILEYEMCGVYIYIYCV